MYMLYLNSDQFVEALASIDTAIIPIGMTEAHGHHCPLGTDVLIPRHLLERVEEQMGHKLIMAPEIPYGHSWNLAPYPGTVDIDFRVFADYVYQVGQGLAKWGIKKIVLFNGHGGNVPALTHVMERLADDGHTVLLINWWLDYAQDILTICQGQGHAGEDETSAVLAIDPNLVDMSKATINWNRATANIRFPGMPLRTLENAMTGDATKATREKGLAIMDLCTARIVDLLQHFLAKDLVKDFSPDLV